MDVLLELFLELLLELALSLLGDSIVEGRRHPAFATVGFTVIGVVLGFWMAGWFPQHFIHSPAARAGNVLVLPLFVGFFTGARGYLTKAERFRWSGFLNGAALAFGATLTRYALLG